MATAGCVEIFGSKSSVPSELAVAFGVIFETARDGLNVEGKIEGRRGDMFVNFLEVIVS